MSFQRTCPLESHRTCLILQQRSVTTCVTCCQLGKLLRDYTPRVFIGGCGVPPLPGTCQHSRLPEGKQVFRVNHTVCINSLDIGSQNGYPFRQRQEHSKFTDTSSGRSGANLVPTPFIGQMSVVLCSLFLHTPLSHPCSVHESCLTNTLDFHSQSMPPAAQF